MAYHSKMRGVLDNILWIKCAIYHQWKIKVAKINEILSYQLILYKTNQWITSSYICLSDS